jgi:hypothetical protein
MPSSPLQRRPTTARGPEAGTVLTGTPEPSRAAPPDRSPGTLSDGRVDGP